MTIANPDYNPGWEIIHDYHHENRVRLEAEIKSFHSAISDDYKHLEQLNQELNFHHQTCLHCLETLQHKTVADYVAWLFGNFYTGEGESFVPLGEEFETMQEARDAFSYLLNAKQADSQVQNHMLHITASH